MIPASGRLVLPKNRCVAHAEFHRHIGIGQAVVSRIKRFDITGWHTVERV